jgi:hypothetical protein
MSGPQRRRAGRIAPRDATELHPLSGVRGGLAPGFGLILELPGEERMRNHGQNVRGFTELSDHRSAVWEDENLSRNRILKVVSRVSRYLSLRWE